MTAWAFADPNRLRPKLHLKSSNKLYSNSFDVKQSILKRQLPESDPADEPQSKRQKSVEPSSLSTISDKVAADLYTDLDEVATDILAAIKASLADLKTDGSEETDADVAKRIAGVNEFRDRAIEILQREQSYGLRQPDSKRDVRKQNNQTGEMVLSLLGYAPQERRLFSSMPISKDMDLSESPLPAGVTLSYVRPTTPKEERVQTLGELFAPARSQPPLQAPKPPRNQAKGSKLDFYHPELTDRSAYPGNNYFNTQLTAGYYLDYSQAAPVSPSRSKHHQRAQSLAGKKPSEEETKAAEMEALFRGAFSSFAPCKDDSAALVPSSVAGRMWWQRGGSNGFQAMLGVEYDNKSEDAGEKTTDADVIDPAMIEEAIEQWDDNAVDPSLDEIMGSKHTEDEKEVDEILEEVGHLIETLSSYQRIRNLNLPNSHNRPGSEPVSGDMLANAAPKPSEEEVATYQMLKAQLALIVKTLPPYAVAKLNGDQLDELLISTRIQVSSDQYKGVMEEDESGVQARIRAQQQAAQQQQASSPRQQRTPSVSGQYPNHYQQQPASHYGTPSRPPSHHQQSQFYRPGMTPAAPYQQSPRQYPPAQQPRPPQPNQYTRTNGYPHQYATQLAKAQTPYGHQNMPQFAGQARPAYGQMPQQGSPQVRHPSYPQNYPQQGTPQQGYNPYTNGGGSRQMSPQMNRQNYGSPSPATPQQGQAQRYGAPNPMQSQMQSQMNRFQAHPQPHQQSPSQPSATSSQSPGIVGYHTVISEAQQQRILDQAKARVAAQERSASFGDKMATPGGLHMGIGNNRSVSMGMQHQPQDPRTPMGQSIQRPPSNGNSRMTPVPLPQMPGHGQQQ